MIDYLSVLWPGTQEGKENYTLLAVVIDETIIETWAFSNYFIDLFKNNNFVNDGTEIGEDVLLPSGWGGPEMSGTTRYKIKVVNQEGTTVENIVLNERHGAMFLSQPKIYPITENFRPIPGQKFIDYDNWG